MYAEQVIKYTDDDNMLLYTLSRLVSNRDGSGLTNEQFAKIFFDQAVEIAPQVTRPVIFFEDTEYNHNININQIIIDIKKITQQYLAKPTMSKERLAILLRIQAVLLWI